MNALTADALLSARLKTVSVKTTVIAIAASRIGTPKPTATTTIIGTAILSASE